MSIAERKFIAVKFSEGWQVISISQIKSQSTITLKTLGQQKFLLSFRKLASKKKSTHMIFM